MPSSPPPPHDPQKLPRFRSSDGTYDEPYAGLDFEMQRENLSMKELKRLKFVRWTLFRHETQYDEFAEDDE